jgi:sporulation protein YlmC with PRC-barrel domain
MVNITINAHVKCSDGACGKSTNVIVNPVNHQVTHIVIKDNSLPDNSTRLVPVGKVASATQDQITLSCTKEELAKMPTFIVTSFIQTSTQGMAYESGAAYTSQYVLNDTAYDSVREENIPAGEMELHSGMRVEATDGKLGKLDELVLDAKSGEITHLLMRKGHAFGEREVIIPLDLIDHEHEGTVYLKISKDEVADLIALKAGWGHDPSEEEVEEALDSQ